MGHWSILNALVYVAVRICNKPYVVCPAGALPIFGRSKHLKKFYNWVIGRRIIRNANARIAITQDECKHFENYSIPSDSVVIIPNGVNPKDFLVKNINDFKNKHGIDSQPFILFLGRLNIIKGPDLLLEAFIKGRYLWPNWHLVFIGPDGGLLSSLKKRAEASGIESRIHFAGYVGGSAKSSAYHAADLLVIPSRQEAMSIVVLEAGISGTPVILTDQCGFNEISNTGSAIVTSATVDGLYQALDEMIKNADQFVAMGTVLKKFVLNNYTWSVAVKKYLDLYKQLLRK
jgi:glycosyltransferase involved in cell wall biosynthesis